jgi:hypothetical protein
MAETAKSRRRIPPERRDPHWFTAAYNLAAAYGDLHTKAASSESDESSRRQTPAELLELARDTAERLVTDSELALGWLEARPVPRRRRRRQGARPAPEATWPSLRRLRLRLAGELPWVFARELQRTLDARRDFLERVRGPAIVLLAGILARDPKSAEVAPGEGLFDEVAGRELDRSRFVIRLDERSLTPGEAVGYLRVGGPIDYRTHYNLACYYTGISTQARPRLDDALKELALGVETGDLLAWALEDPALKRLRKERSAEFYATLGLESPLSRLDPIGRSGAANLKDAGITTPGELMRQTRTPEDRNALSNAIGIHADLLLAWRDLAELNEIPKVDIDIANLLSAGGISSLERLAASEPGDLRAILANAREIHDLDVDVPDEDVLAEWIAHAHERLSRTE